MTRLPPHFTPETADHDADLRAAMQDLLDGLARLGDAELSPEHARHLAQSRAAATALEQLLTRPPTLAQSSPTVPNLDHAEIDRLIEMAGPELGARFLEHFRADLRSAFQALQAALDPPQWPGLRETSHVLVALAGTAGAKTLQAEARDLNRSANQSDAEAVADQGPRLCHHLAELIAELDAYQPLSTREGKA